MSWPAYLQQVFQRATVILDAFHQFPAVSFKLICRPLSLYAVRNAGVRLRSFLTELQHSYRIRSRTFGQNWHLDALGDTTDMARSSTMGRSSKVFEGTSLAPEIDKSKSIMTLAQR